jgi:hypothetical protein
VRKERSGRAGRFAGGKLTGFNLALPVWYASTRPRTGTFYTVVKTLALFISKLEREKDKMDHTQVANRKSLEAFIEEYLPER